MTDNTKNPIYHDDAAARRFLEELRWPEGVLCVHCGAFGDDVAAVQNTGKRTKPAAEGKRYRPAREGLYYCNACKKQFSVTVGTVMEDSHIPIHKWVYAFHLMCSSKKGISAHQMHRMLGLSYKSAWYLGHRIREAMRSGFLAPPMGGDPSKIVEADETYIGRKAGQPKGRRAMHHKNAVLTLIDRSTGEARSFHIDNADGKTIIPIVQANVAKETSIATDEAKYYGDLRKGYYHATVNHSAEEWVAGPYHTNSAENYYSVFKRGVKGVYQHVSEKHLHRYLAEFDFRYSNRAKLGVDDTKRTDRALRGIEGKRLTYRRTRGARPQPDEAPF